MLGWGSPRLRLVRTRLAVAALAAGLLPATAAAQPVAPAEPPVEEPLAEPPAEEPSVSPAAAAVAVVVPRNVGTVEFGAERLGIPVVTVAAGVTITGDGVVATARTAVAGAPFVLLAVPGAPALVPASVSRRRVATSPS